ncbi:MAG: VOC family protein [Pseudomonadota bacterium]
MLAFDHALVLHPELAAGVRAAERLGFAPTPIGRHGQGMGTANATIMMPDQQTYLELLAVSEPTARNADKRAALAARGAHLFGAAFKGDAREAAARFEAAGIAGGDAFDFARPVASPTGPQDARFAIAPIRSGALPGLSAFVCQHFTPELVWRPDRLDHPNGARAIIRLWGVADAPEALGAAWRAVVSDAVRSDRQSVDVALGAARASYLTPTAWAERFGARAPAPHAPGSQPPELRAIEVAAGPEPRLLDALEAGAIAFDRVEGRLRVADAFGLGAEVFFAPI